MAKSKTLTGIAASPGFGVGRAVVLATPESIETRRIRPGEEKGERARLTAALGRARDELRQAMGELEELGEKAARDMVGVELMVLEDPASLEAFDERIREEHLSAEAAVQAVAALFTLRYSQAESDRFKDRAWDVAAAFRVASPSASR